jgi:hypothetical protein
MRAAGIISNGDLSRTRARGGWRKFHTARAAGARGQRIGAAAHAAKGKVAANGQVPVHDSVACPVLVNELNATAVVVPTLWLGKLKIDRLLCHRGSLAVWIRRPCPWFRTR